MKPTPMMVQYLDIKEKYKEHILFFRLGDFYEMFFDDAITVSKELELTLTGKDCGLEERAPMCGIPFHSSNTYIPKLIDKGYTVAICEQVEDAKDVVKGIVKRDVVKIITPGTLTDNNSLNDKKNNYIASIHIYKNNAAISYCDVSTGEVKVSKVITYDIVNKIFSQLARINPAEVIIKSEEDLLQKNIIKRFNTYVSKYDNYDKNDNITKLIKNIKLDKIEEDSLTLLLNYIFETQKNSQEQINKIELFEIDKYVELDVSTRNNLEIEVSNRTKQKKGSLLWVLDKTVTAMGTRMLTKWIKNPLTNVNEINKRLNATEVLINQFIIKDELEELLKNVYDIERIIAKVVNNSAMPREFVTLKNSLFHLPKIKELLLHLAKETNDEYIIKLCNDLDSLKDVYTLLQSAIIEDPPLTIKDGEIFKLGYNNELDELKNVKIEGNNWLMELEAKEKELTNIKMLKVSYNRIFGYYIEVTNSYKSLVPKDRYITKQTLAGCERYITEELKNLEEKILNSDEKLKTLEYKLFVDLREKVGGQILRIQQTAEVLATIDTLCSFSKVSILYNYTKPEIVENGQIIIEDGRHPVVEKALNDTSFIPNDTLLDNNENILSIITGPNMAGKSTYMRQVALITYLAQIGCYVPASKAKISVVDKIFTRIGASDDLAMGESTFMVEMTELANILKNATEKSLVILDEIGRGTGAYDGLAIAWATAEHISNITKCKTLFATHYHELTELEDSLNNVKNYAVSVEENGEDVIFMHKIVKGHASSSYGIHVAKLAGLPSKTLTRAKVILKDLKLNDLAKKKIEESKSVKAEEIAVDIFNYNLNELANELKAIDLDELSPKEALEKLYKLKEILN